MNSTVLAISSFRSDKKVLELLDLIFSSDTFNYLEVIVVDSNSTGLIDEYILKKNISIKYIESDVNLGSAGNLALRLQEAARNINAKWCLCLNHDAFYTEEFAKDFIKKAENIDGKIGAVFPTRAYGNGRLHKVESAEKMGWSSSNGCLYSLEPVRNGIQVEKSLWMGWEDYFYCYLLVNSGYPNYIVNSLPFIDSYEYKSINFFGLKIKLNDKPSWYDYYSVRNLIYIGKNIKIDKVYLKLLFKVIINSTFMSLFKDKKRERLSFFIKGCMDGFKSRMGFKDII